jgi:putative DNA primase/helicase
VIIADKDKSGRQHAQQVVNALSGTAASIKVLELPDWNGHEVKDFSDWLAAGGSQQELRRLVDSIPPYSSSQEVTGSKTKHLALTDTANAEYMVSLHGDGVRYDHRLGRWLLWQGHRWNEDLGDSVYRLAISSIRKRYSEAATIDDLDQREKVARWCISSEQRSRLESMIALARMLKPIADDGQEWDTNPWLLGVHNGVVELRTSQLRPGRP